MLATRGSLNIPRSFMILNVLSLKFLSKSFEINLHMSFSWLKIAYYFTVWYCSRLLCLVIQYGFNTSSSSNRFWTASNRYISMSSAFLVFSNYFYWMFISFISSSYAYYIHTSSTSNTSILPYSRDLFINTCRMGSTSRSKSKSSPSHI
jgi:hypothetical protein